MCYNKVMLKRGKLKKVFLKWIDECELALRGILLATRRLKFWLGAGLGWVIFGTLLNLLAGGGAAFGLMNASDWGGKLQIMGDAFLGLFGIGRNFWDWLLIFGVSLLQGILIGLVALVWADRKRASSNGEHLQRTGIVAGLAVLGSGCPTCGTTLLGPLLASVVGSGSLVVAGTISGILTTLAIVVGLLALKKLGFEVYVIMVDEKYRRKHARANN